MPPSQICSSMLCIDTSSISTRQSDTVLMFLIYCTVVYLLYRFDFPSSSPTYSPMASIFSSVNLLPTI
jgi:hypothetical protein